MLIAVLLIITQSVWARGTLSTTGTSTNTISYQGRLADSSGAPITALQNMEFRLYDAPSGGAPLWEEFWTGGNAVQVSDGLFNVMLGSLNTNLTSVVQGNDPLYLGITVGTDSEMSPRVQLGSVPFSMQALTVPDGSITGVKIANNVITTTHILDGAITASKLANRGAGALQSWSNNVNESFAATGSSGPRITFDTGIDVTVPTGETHYYLVTYEGTFNYLYSERSGAASSFYGYWVANLVNGGNTIDSSVIVSTGYRMRWDSVGGSWYWNNPYWTTWIVALGSGTHSLDIEISGYSDATMSIGHVTSQKLSVISIP